MDISCGLTNNVTIKVFDKSGRPISKQVIHNKVTQKMVLGILKYLQGHFTMLWQTFWLIESVGTQIILFGLSEWARLYTICRFLAGGR